MNEKTIIEMPTADLVPYARNAKKHGAGQVDKIVKSIRDFGFNNPVLIDGDRGIIAGHGRVMAALKMGLNTVPTICLDHLDETKKRAYILADNRLAELSAWDGELLAFELADLRVSDVDLVALGFDDEGGAGGGLTDEDEVPEVQEVAVSADGDVWQLGQHRVMCGDSLSVAAVDKLMGGRKAALLHADPPYGMGKEGDGVANDNLYREKLDAFQMGWWRAFRRSVDDNGSAYIWGNAPDLWRLWFVELHASEMLVLKNQVVWDKKNIAGMKSDLLNQYPITTEHCLFIAIGDQFDGNTNTSDYFAGWDEVRLYLLSEADRNGITAKKIREVCGVQMYSHWFTKAQFSMIPEVHYATLADAFPGSFLKSWGELKKTHDNAQAEFRKSVDARRSYFDNGHEVMRDVWEFPRVHGEERHGHATPKPVAMMERVMKSSLPEGGLCVEPFGGSGSTLMGAEKTGRICYSMELQAEYCDVMVKRWQDFTGRAAVHATTGKTFDESAELGCSVKKEEAVNV